MPEPADRVAAGVGSAAADDRREGPVVAAGAVWPDVPLVPEDDADEDGVDDVDEAEPGAAGDADEVDPAPVDDDAPTPDEAGRPVPAAAT